MTDDNPTVLVVEDDASVSRALSRLIRSTGRQVRTFASADELLEQDSLPNGGCLVLDLRMPGMGGLALQKRIAAQGCSLPIVVITGHADEDLCRRAFERGAVAVLLKPFDDQELLDAIDRAFRR